jgi:phosphoenolpyruvate carboxykinase (GTP)
VQQSFDWAHGVITMAASLESETTAATLGKEGVRTFQPMANLDFVSIPLGRYIQNHLDFAEGLSATPLVFAVNYFLKNKDGEYLNGMADKNVWMKWMELRVNGDVTAFKTPTGCIPGYQDLKRLFQEVLGKDYTSEQYVEQFTLRVPENLAKLDRIEQIYRTDVADTPRLVFDVLAEQRERLTEVKERKGEYVSPLDMMEVSLGEAGQ